ncbi:MAG TPA: phosphoribosylglycinamide formyltransferase [Candidatus Monoglobus merdigallinarum]|uniref:Phosphoribosylglycinamide formyltransferase n=1 Tax=Candidatus Monoglobus merdigallinarum TaxID=2838698 RepID=A0A9D1PQF1_9FIRM|nr:phosphoribosylglycinamide formyltransferase [Candidatus Monoglobus merdigallinarum]
MLKIGVLVSGGGTNLQAIIDAIDSGKITNAEIVTVVGSRPGIYALKRAENHNIPSIVISRKSYDSAEEHDMAVCRHMQSCGAELIVMAGYLSIVGSGLIRAFENRIINIHPSLIPSFCGPGFYGIKVHEAALERGVKLTGATVHIVNEVCDGGPILLQKAVEVKSGDTPEILQRRVMEEAEWEILPRAIDMIANNKL